MKKIAITLGLASAGAGVVHAAYAPDASQDKTWAISASLRGNYNDNPTTVHSGKLGSFGYSVLPQLQIVKPYNQTELGLRYIYTLNYYGNLDKQGQNPYMQSHWVNLWLDHVFNERWEVKASDAILVTQDPVLGLGGANPTVNPFNNGNYINNNAQASLHTDWTREIGTVVTYNNSLTLYDESGGKTNDVNYFLPGSAYTGRGPSFAGQFNRMDQTATLDVQYHSSPETIYGLGYSYEWVNYTAGEPIGYNWTSGTLANGYTDGKYFYSNSRDSQTHTVYLSYQHNLSSTFRLTAQLGAQMVNEINQNIPTTIYPYANLSATYNYAPGSYVSAGFTESMNSSYLPSIGQAGAVNTNNATISAFQESSTVFISVNHQITPKLTAFVSARYQNSTFKEGSLANDTDSYYSIAASLTYVINRHWSVEADYSFDQVDTAVTSSSYTRNQYAIGVTATY